MQGPWCPTSVQPDGVEANARRMSLGQAGVQPGPRGAHMTTTATKATLAAGLLAAAGVAGYWHYSPYLTVNAMRKAAEQKDVQSFSERVDYVKVRESVKSQLATKLAGQMRAGADEGQSSKGLKALGAAFAMALANPLIDAVVRPEFVMAALTKGEIEVVPGEVKEAVGVVEPPKDKPRWAFDRQGANKLVAYVKDPEAPGEIKAGLVFERSGFADWKLTGLNLPENL